MSARRFALGAAVAVLATALYGIWMRLWLGGAVALPATPAHWRHAHSHAGVYAILFPLVWIAWRRLGLPILDRRGAALYFVACAVAVAFFTIAGYALPSIVASTVVGALWLFSAWSIRSVLRDRRGPLRLVPVAIVLATALIPAIAVATRRDPPLADGLAHAFLTVLFFLVVVPSALARLELRASPWVIGPLGVVAAGHLGPLPNLAGAVALAGYGVAIGWAARGAPPIPRALWWMFALGSVVMLAFPNGLPREAAIAGLHFLVLGPAFVSLVDTRRSIAVTLAASAVAMGAALLARPALGSWSQLLAGAAGGVWALAAVVALLRWRAALPRPADQTADLRG